MKIDQTKAPREAEGGASSLPAGGLVRSAYGGLLHRFGLAALRLATSSRRGRAHSGVAILQLWSALLLALRRCVRTDHRVAHQPMASSAHRSAPRLAG